jgi:hypothetical protein
MGPSMMRRPPQYCNGFIDRHGKPRWYFRRAGFKKVPLPGLPWSPEFMAAYERALAGQPAPVGAERTIPGTLRALTVSYFASPEFRTTKPSTQYTYRNVIDRLCAEHGDKRVALLHREHVIKLLAARAHTPGTANALRRSLRALMQHAVEIGLRSDDPARDVRKIPTAKGDGYHSWTEAEIAQFECRHPSALARGSPSHCCFIPASGDRMWCEWAASTSTTARSAFANRRPAERSGSPCTRRWHRSSVRRPPT